MPIKVALVLSLLVFFVGCAFMSRMARTDQLKKGSVIAVVASNETKSGSSIENLLSASLVDRGMVPVNLRQILPGLGKIHDRVVDEGDIMTTGVVSKIFLLNDAGAVGIGYEEEIKLINTIIELWSLEYVLIVTSERQYTYDVQLVDVRTKRITFSYHVTADAGGWEQHMPDVEPNPNYRVEPPKTKMPLVQLCEHIANLLIE